MSTYAALNSCTRWKKSVIYAQHRKKIVNNCIEYQAHSDRILPLKLRLRFMACYTRTTYKFTAKVLRRSDFIDVANIFRLQNLKIEKVVAIKKHIICGSENADSRLVCKITEESCYHTIWTSIFAF